MTSWLFAALLFAWTSGARTADALNDRRDRRKNAAIAVSCLLGMAVAVYRMQEPTP
jgi:MFS family permease